jgi:hypothetical protein
VRERTGPGDKASGPNRQIMVIGLFLQLGLRETSPRESYSSAKGSSECFLSLTDDVLSEWEQVRRLQCRP